MQLLSKMGVASFFECVWVLLVHVFYNGMSFYIKKLNYSTLSLLEVKMKSLFKENNSIKISISGVKHPCKSNHVITTAGSIQFVFK